MKEAHGSNHLIMKKIQTYLAYRAHSEYELELKLSKKFNKTEIKQALLQAEKNNWLDKPDEMSRQLADKWHRKNRGWLFIQAQILKKKLPLPSKREDLEEKKCLWWLHKKWSNLEDPPQKTIQKIYRFLSHKGFEAHTIREITRKRWTYGSHSFE